MTTAVLVEAFDLLRTRDSTGGYVVRATALPLDGLWLYVTKEDRPGLLLVEVSPSAEAGSVIGHVAIQRGRATTIATPDTEIEVAGTTIECVSTDALAHGTFLRLLTASIDEGAGGGRIEQCIRNIRRLLAAASGDRARDLQGLWAELVTIAESRDPGRAVTAWHVDNAARFDFLDDAAAAEIKSSVGSVRRHRFSAEQLTAPPDCLVVSYLLQPDDTGPSLLELFDECLGRLSTPLEAAKLAELFFGSVGERHAAAETVRFNRHLALDTRRSYKATDLQALRPPFPPGISNVRFDVDLSLVEPAAVVEAHELWRAVLARG